MGNSVFTIFLKDQLIHTAFIFGKVSDLKMTSSEGHHLWGVDYRCEIRITKSMAVAKLELSTSKNLGCNEIKLLVSNIVSLHL